MHLTPHAISTQVRGFFPRSVNRQLKELYVTAGIIDFTLSMVTILEPVYLYTQGFSLTQIMFWYAIVYGLYAALLPFGGKLVGWLGTEKTILVATPSFIAYYASLFAIPFIPWMIWVAAILYAVQKTAYWPAYLTDFAISSDAYNRDKEISAYNTIQSVMYVAGPLFAGVIVQAYGFPLLFLLASILLVSSSIPMLRTPEAWQRVNFSYHSFFKFATQKKHRRLLFSYLGYGEELIVLGFWPVFLYIVVGDYVSLGSLIAVSVLVTMVLMIFIGRLTDVLKKRSLVRIGVLLYATSWLLRTLVSSAPIAFGTDTFSRVAKQTLWIPFTALTFETAEKQDTLGFMVFSEWALAIGKLIAAILAAIIFSTIGSFSSVFVLAAMMTLLYALL